MINTFTYQVNLMIGFKSWICPRCNIRIDWDIYSCPDCNMQYLQQDKIQQFQNTCPKCEYINEQTDNSCKICTAVIRRVPKVKIMGVKCSKCYRQNDNANLVCVFCDEDLFEIQKKICDICGINVKLDKFEPHYQNCLLNKQFLIKEQQELRLQNKKQEKNILQDLQECIYCRIKFIPQALELHLIQCKLQILKNQQFKHQRMTPLQAQVINYITLKSQKQHNEVKGTLKQRIKKLGYTIQDLNNLQFYVQTYAPIIIHFHLSKYMTFFLKDTHYRSQFQTNKSQGCLNRYYRTTWQDRIFDKKYSKATNFQRVKYGAINFTNDPKGVGACLNYGQSYFQMKSHVRPRCTLTDADTSVATSIGTFNKMNDNELKAAFDASKAKQIPSSFIKTYKEIQIHGPIEFAKDIQRIYVNRNQLKVGKNLLDMVYEFNKKFGVDYDFF